MLQEGTMLDNRYELLSRIGTGGMSDVYKAMDHKLNRFVAIKVLKAEFSENRSFVSKFRVEAQSAAILTHPNIVNVYDVGSEESLHYIVMELVEGVTLKRYIEKKIRLSVKETISIAIQVSMGIENAHNNHIIHRDIKPQNIIISKEGKVKVTDFGIARAATSDTITSNAMGSVHYTSPEQARGGYSDEKSDIYSLGITMFEMITGRVPFDGDTTVAIAIAHIQEELPSPKIYAEDIPFSLEQIILKCCQKRPDRRYQTMAELVADLKRALLDPDGDFVKVVPAEKNIEKTVMVTKDQIDDIRSQTGSINSDIITAATETEIEQDEDRESSAKIMVDDNLISGRRRPVRIKSEGDAKDEVDDIMPRPRKKAPADRPKANQSRKREEGRPKKRRPEEGARKNRRVDDFDDEYAKRRKRRQASKSANHPRRALDEYDEYDDDDSDPGMEKVMSILGIIAAIIIVIIAIFVVTKVFDIFKSTTSSIEKSDDKVTMIDVTGKTFDEAKTALRSLGLDVEATYESSSTVEKNIVMEQDIKEGENIPEGTKVELTVSSGTDGVSVPDVTGLSEAEAKVKLENEGFSMEKDYSASDTVEKGNVISQNPGPGSNAAANATITVVISQGASTTEVSVPDIRLQTQEDAMKILQEAGLSVGSISTESSPTVPIGCVVTQSYSPNVMVPSGTSVSFTLSDGASGGVYKCNLAVTAPTGYMGGNADVVLTQNDTGIVLFATTTTAFPVAINVANITGTPGCTLSIRYDVAKTTVIEAEDGTPTPIVTTESVTDSQIITLSEQ